MVLSPSKNDPDAGCLRDLGENSLTKALAAGVRMDDLFD
jgi:hypothetical protein